MTVAQVKSQPKPGLAQSIKAPVSARMVIGEIAKAFKILPGVNFSLINYQSPQSLPQSCAQILYQEKLLDQQGQTIFKNLSKLNDENFLNQLKLKLIYGIIKSQWRQHLFQISDLARLSQPEKHHRYLLAFSRLFSDYYSYFPTDIFVENRYIHLASPRLALNRLSHKEALLKAKTALYERIDRDNGGLIASINPFLSVIDKKSSTSLGNKFINQLVDSIKRSEIIMPEHELSIDRKSFPKINLSLSLPED